LPRVFTNNSERLARFEREARMLAALNHPHIGAIYGVEEVEGVRALVLELVDGDTLAERLQRRPIPVAEALTIARQIAEALDAAHEKGIIHRDLKPANIKVTADGIVKVLDFGLAKAAANAGSSPDLTQSPTVTVGGTRDGVILGTSAYMSPEQARGLAVDKRTDIWAFGCVLYEMLTRRVAFAGDTVSDTIAKILEREPDWISLPSSTPRSVHRLLARCLEKDPKRRLRDIGDAQTDLIAQAVEGPAKPSTTSYPQWALLFAVAFLALVGSWVLRPVVTGRAEPPASDYGFTPFATDQNEETFPAWSHDGKTLAYVVNVGGTRQIFTKNLDSAVPAQVTSSPTDCSNPFWSPDGTRIYYNAEGRLWSISAAGGQPTVEVDAADAASIASNGKTLAFLRGAGGNMSLWFAAGRDSVPEQYQTPPFPRTFTRSWSIDFSSDGSKLAVLIEQQGSAGFDEELWIVPYPSGIPRQVPTKLVGLAGPPTAGRVNWTRDSRHVILDGTVPDVCGHHLYLLDTRDANARSIAVGLGEEWTPAVSPVGDTLAFATGGVDFDVLQFPLDGSDVRTLVSGSRSEQWPAWATSGNQLAYVTDASGCQELRVMNVKEGWGVPVLTQGSSDLPFWLGLQKPTFSSDGRRLAYGVNNQRHAIYVSPAAGGRPIALDNMSIDQHNATWAPDGNWLAYQRLYEGRWELVKAPLGGGEPVRLDDAAAGGGTDTAWSPKGNWIAHVRAGALWLVSSDGTTRRVISQSTPVTWAFSHDGSSLYAIRRPARGEWELLTIDVDSGRQLAIKKLKLPASATVRGFALHPDGKSFATSVGIAKFDIWLLHGLNSSR